MTTEQQGKGTWAGVGSLMPSPCPSKVNHTQAASLGKVQETCMCGVRPSVM